MKEKIFKRIVWLLFVLIMGVTGTLIGTKVEQRRVERENRRDTIQNIAVVNLDEGIYQNNKKLIYADQLVQLPDSNFLMAGLEDARNGIIEGRYAAYIILPTEFSQNVVSINGIPQKVMIQYEMNQNLRGDISTKTIDDIREFELLLNVNMSYMYLDAILKEFHEVQDSAKIIMKNDDEDLNTLHKISPLELMVLPELFEIIPIENKAQEPDLTSVYNANNEIIETMQKTYEESITKGKESFNEVKKQNTLIANAITDTQKTFATINFEKDEKGDSIIEKGVEDINKKIEEQLELQNIAKNDIINKLSDGTVSGPQIRQESVSNLNTVSANKVENKINQEMERLKEEIKKVEEEHNNTLAKKKKEITNKLDDLESIAHITASDKQVIQNILDEMVTIDIVVDWKIAITNELQEEKKNIERQVKQEINTQIKDDLNAFPTIQISLFQDSIDKGIMQVLKEECLVEQSKMDLSTQKVATEMESYEGAIEKFDPYEYLDEGAIDTSLNQFLENINKMETDLDETIADNSAFVSENCEVANETIFKMNENLQNSYLKTEGNVVKAVEDTKGKREVSNSTNIKLLESFSKKLPYTRLGTMEYEQAYDFIANPVETKNAGKEAPFKVVSMGEPKALKIVLAILLGMLISTLAIHSGRNALRIRKEKNIYYTNNN